MYITHPNTMFQGIAPEDVFFVFNDMKVQLGIGYVVKFFQQELYPERPQHLYVQIDAQPSARSLLYGALLARAEQIRGETPGVPTRLYTQLEPKDEEMLQFYTQMGFRNDDEEDMYRFQPPLDGRAMAPMGFQYASIPLDTYQAEEAMIARFNARRIQAFTRDYLTLWRQQPHFLALAFYRQNAPVCEALLTGAGSSATLLMVYTEAQYRRQGLAKQLVGAAGVHLMEQGVTTVNTQVFKRNVPQMALMHHLSAVYHHTVNLLPGINL